MAKTAIFSCTNIRKGVEVFTSNKTMTCDVVQRIARREGSGMEVTMDLVKEFFESNKESDDVKSFTQSLVGKDAVESYLNTDDGKKVLQPKLDKHYTKGLETWKANNLQSLIDSEVNKKFPAESEDQKQLRALQSKFEALEKEKAMALVRAEALQELGAKGLPTSMADFLLADSAEATRERIGSFAELFNSALNNGITTEVDSRLKNIGITPKDEGNGTHTEAVTKDQLLNMDYDKRVEYFTANPEVYKTVMNG